MAPKKRQYKHLEKARGIRSKKKKLPQSFDNQQPSLIEDVDLAALSSNIIPHFKNAPFFDVSDPSSDSTSGGDDDEEDIEFDNEVVAAELVARGFKEENTSKPMLNSFSIMSASIETNPQAAFTHFRYDRGPELSDRQQRRHRENARKLEEAAASSKSIRNYFTSNTLPSLPSPPKLVPSPSLEDSRKQAFQLASQELKKKIESKSSGLSGQDLTRHRIVLQFLNLHQCQKEHETRNSIATLLARTHGKGRYFAEKILLWEQEWMTTRVIPAGLQGKHSKRVSLLEHEGIRATVDEYLASAGEYITAYNLAEAVRKYIHSLQQAEGNTPETSEMLDVVGQRGTRVTARTARKWLHQLGLEFGLVRKDVFVDGHEREDVVNYRSTQFIPRWREYERRLVVFDEKGNWTSPPTLLPGERPLVLVTHDESSFNSNDGKQYIWARKGEQPIRPKGRGKGIMVSGFLTPRGILAVPDAVSDQELRNAHPEWNSDENQKLIRDSLKLHEYGKDNYWTGDKMVDHAVKEVALIFPYAFPGCQALFAFDNASSHCCFAEDALIASKMNLSPGGKQPLMRNTINSLQQHPQTMVFPDHPDVPERLRGKAKGLEQVLRERGLWRNGLRLQCPKVKDVPQCNGQEGCCARRIMASQPDFQAQLGKLAEQLISLGHEVIFYPKFHCELNFIERYWCACKEKMRKECTYDFQKMKEKLPLVLRAIPDNQVFHYFEHCMRILDAYEKGFGYGTEEFKASVHRNHRQVVDPSKY